MGYIKSLLTPEIMDRHITLNNGIKLDTKNLSAETVSAFSEAQKKSQTVKINKQIDHIAFQLRNNKQLSNKNKSELYSSMKNLKQLKKSL